jgi:hypothetical protein
VSIERTVRVDTFTCQRHGKVAYRSRREARGASRRHHDSGLREYRCTAFRGCWHIGHMPPMVKRGELTIAEWFRLPRRERQRRWAAEG